MIDLKPIKPMLHEDYISPHLKEEERKREIAPMSKEGQSWLVRAWFWLVRAVTKFLRKYG